MPGPGGAGEPAIHVLDDPEATARAAAEAIVDALRSAIDARGNAHWATTGGSTPFGIYRALVEPPLRDALDWTRVHTWWGDDRFVPRDDPLANALSFDEILAPAIPEAARHAHAMPMGEAIGAGRGTDWIAAAYSDALHTAFPEVDAPAVPPLDVVLLGMGPDGHVLSVFPGSPLFDAEDWVIGVAAPTHIEPHVARVSLNPAFVTAARLSMVVAHGSAKAGTIASVLAGPRNERHLPAQLARRSGAAFFLDRSAAAALPR